MAEIEILTRDEQYVRQSPLKWQASFGYLRCHTLTTRLCPVVSGRRQSTVAKSDLLVSPDATIAARDYGILR